MREFSGSHRSATTLVGPCTSPNSPHKRHPEQSTCLRQVEEGMNEVRQAVITSITPNGSATLPFVIPSEAEGSAVHSAFATKVRGKNKFVIPTGAKRSGATVCSLHQHPTRRKTTQNNLAPMGLRPWATSGRPSGRLVSNQTLLLVAYDEMKDQFAAYPQCAGNLEIIRG